MSLHTWITNDTGKPICPTHGAVLTYIEQASGERRERWLCPVDEEEFEAPAP